MTVTPLILCILSRFILSTLYWMGVWMIVRIDAHIIIIMETKLTPKANTPKVHYFTTVRTDLLHKAGGGLITLIIDNFKWSWYILTTLNISQLQTCINLLETAHPRTTKQLTRTTTLHTIHHKHTTLSPHRRCEHILHSLAFIH